MGGGGVSLSQLTQVAAQRIHVMMWWQFWLCSSVFRKSLSFISFSPRLEVSSNHRSPVCDSFKALRSEIKYKIHKLAFNKFNI